MKKHEIRGRLVILRPATDQDKRQIYAWLALSDATPTMMGPPVYPDEPIPSWEEFCADYKPYYFDDSAPDLGRCFVISVNGEAVGQVNYNDIEEHQGKKRTELDIWLRSEKDCGQGFGTDALLTLCQHLFLHLGVQEFVVQPSARNPRAIRAYGKAGFVKLPLSIEEAQQQWGARDYFDSVYMVKTISPDEGRG